MSLSVSISSERLCVKSDETKFHVWGQKMIQGILLSTVNETVDGDNVLVENKLVVNLHMLLKSVLPTFFRSFCR